MRCVDGWRKSNAGENGRTWKSAGFRAIILTSLLWTMVVMRRKESTLLSIVTHRFPTCYVKGALGCKVSSSERVWQPCLLNSFVIHFWQWVLILCNLFCCLIRVSLCYNLLSWFVPLSLSQSDSLRLFVKRLRSTPASKAWLGWRSHHWMYVQLLCIWKSRAILVGWSSDPWPYMMLTWYIDAPFEALDAKPADLVMGWDIPRQQATQFPALITDTSIHTQEQGLSHCFSVACEAVVTCNKYSVQTTVVWTYAIREQAGKHVHINPGRQYL